MGLTPAAFLQFYFFSSEFSYQILVLPEGESSELTVFFVNHNSNFVDHVMGQLAIEALEAEPQQFDTNVVFD